MVKIFLVLCAYLIVASDLTTSCLAQSPRSMSFQGYLTNPGGAPIDGTETMTVRLFDLESLGTEVWTRTYVDVGIAQGAFGLVLENGSPTLGDLLLQDSLWIELTVDGEVLSPRTPLRAVPFARGLSLPIWAHANIGGNGTAALRLENEATVGTNYGLYAESASESGRAVFGHASSFTGASAGVYGSSSAVHGRGVSGAALLAGSGISYGVDGVNYSTNGRGVYGQAHAATGNTYGVYGEAWSTAGTAVFGDAIADTGVNYGVRGEAASSAGWGGYFIGGSGTYTRGQGNDAPDLVLGGFSLSNDDGRIFSDPAYPASDIWLHSNDAVVVVLDNDASGEDADFEVRDNALNVVFNVDEDGTVTADGVIVHSSDRNRKEGIVPVDPGQILEEVVRLPVQGWQFKGQTERHVGPMAQDFYSAFGLGADDRHIAAVDADGVALAAIKGLYELVREQQAEIDELKRSIIASR